MPEPVTPPPLPDALLGETPTAKLLWLYLRPKGPVGYSTRKLAAAVYGSHLLVCDGLCRLRALGLLEDLGEHRERQELAMERAALAEAVDRVGSSFLEKLLLAFMGGVFTLALLVFVQRVVPLLVRWVGGWFG